MSSNLARSTKCELAVEHSTVKVLIVISFQADHPGQPKTKQRNQASVKRGCTASIVVKEVFSFPTHKVNKLFTLVLAKHDALQKPYYVFWCVEFILHDRYWVKY